MKHILLVEDDPHIAAIIQYYLSAENQYAVTHAPDAAAALSAVEHTPFDLILLDIMLPESNGMELCANFRQRLYCPILFISCIDDEKTIIEALRMGGDDYLVKPFTSDMLHARMEANLRRMHRSAQSSPESVLEASGIQLDSATHTVKKRGAVVPLSPIEYNILQLLMQHPGVHFTLEQIYETIWERPSLGDSRTVMVHIHNLRKKLEENPNAPQLLKSVRGSGYYVPSKPDE